MSTSFSPFPSVTQCREKFSDCTNKENAVGVQKQVRSPLDRAMKANVAHTRYD